MSTKNTQNTKSQKSQQKDGVTYLLLPPDGGYGWIVACAGFLAMFIGEGTMTSFGLYLQEISEEFETSEKVVAWANSMMNGFYFVTGPVMCALVNRFGYRSIGVLGGIVAGSAFIGSSFLPNIFSFIVVYGVIGGVGFSMLYFSSILVVSIYFEKWRGVAISLTLCGATAGAMGIPQLILVAFDGYTWREQFQYFALLSVLCGLVTLFYKPLYPFEIRTGTEDGHHNLPLQTTEPDEISEFLQLYSIASSQSLISVKKTSSRKSAKSDKSRGSVKSKYSVGVQSLRIQAATDRILNPKTPKERCRYFWTCGCCRGGCSDYFCLNLCELCCCCLIDERCCIHKGMPMSRKDILFTGSVNMLPERKKLGDSKMGTVEYHMSVTTVIPIEEVREERKFCLCCPHSIRNIIKTMLNFSVTKIPSFNLIMLNSLLISMAYYPPAIYITQKAHSEEVPEQIANLLLTIFGGAAMLGRVLCVFISTIPNLNGLLTISTACFLGGISIIVNNLSSHPINQISTMTIFGICGSIAFSLRTPMIVQLYGLESLSSSFGLCMIGYGLAGFIGVPLAALVYDQTESYQFVFYYVGILAAVSGLILYPVQCMRPREIAKELAKKRNQAGPANKI